MTAVLKYTALRAALFVAALVLLGALGASRLTAVVGAAVVSLLLSYVLLRGPRDAAAQAIVDRAGSRLPPGPVPVRPRRGPRLDDDAAAEDAAAEDAVPDTDRRASP